MTDDYRALMQDALRELRRTATYLEANGQDARRLRFMFWSVVARLAALPFAALLALPLLFGPLRLKETGARATLGLALGLAYFILSRMVESGTIALGLNPLVLAWAVVPDRHSPVTPAVR